MTENKEQIKRKKLVGLEAADYEHPLDRAAIKTPGIYSRCKKVITIDLLTISNRNLIGIE